MTIGLFQKIVNGDSTSSQHSEPSQLSLSEWEINARVAEVDKKATSLPEKLRLFESNILPSILSMRGQIPKHLWLSITKFLAAACDSVAEQGQTVGIVGLSRLCARVGKLDLDLRGQLILSLCHTIVTKKLSDSSRGLVVREILAMWKHISQLRRFNRAPAVKDRRPSLQFVLPAADEILKVVDGNGTPANKALASIFTQFPFTEAEKLVPALLATAAILLNPSLTSSIKLAEAAPLLDLVAVALRQGVPDTAHVLAVMRGKMRFPSDKLPDLEAYVVAHWAQVSAALRDEDAPWCRTSETSRFRGRGTSPQLGEFHKQLRVAYAARHCDTIVSIWSKFKAHLVQHPDLADQLRSDAEFLDFWIFVWCAMRRPTLLRDTLQLMDTHGLERTVKSYTAMMHGWKICRDTDRIVMLWQRLIESGLKLDSFIWTERISGLMQGGRHQAGIQALAEMMSLWARAVEEQDVEKAAMVAVQPTIEVVNAALVGLIRADFNAALRVLSWAGRHGIRPNVRTYNILISESLRSRRAVNVPGLLQKMALQGIEPDEATFTIILEDLLGSMDHSTAAEQVQAVTQVLEEMKSVGLRPNLQTYGKMLHAVASLADSGADEAIAAVQSHMCADGLSASPHMVTILIERVLARGLPPSSVQAILREHNFVNVVQGDQTLWERAMSAYATMGDAQASLNIFGDLARAGKPATSLSCLRELLRALLAAGRLDDGRNVVRATLTHRAAHKAAADGDAGRGDDRYWRHHFWHLAFNHGLLSREELPAQWGERPTMGR